MIETFTAAMLRRRWVALLVLTAAVVAVTAGVANLKADFRVEAFFGSSDPETDYLRDYEDRWGAADLLMVIADGGEQGLLARDRLDQLNTLAQVLDDTDGIDAVLSLPRVPRVNRGPAGTFIPAPLISTVPRDDAALEAWRARILSDPSIVPTYLSADGRYGTILLRLGVDTGDLQAVQPVVQRVQRVLETSAPEGMTFFVGGVPAIRADVLGVIVRDQIWAAPAAAVLMGILLILLFRSKHGVIIPALAAGIPNLMLLGVMGWTGEPFGLLNQVYLALIPAIAVADAVHLLSRYHEEARAVGPEQAAALRTDPRGPIAQTMKVMGVAVFLTSFTTMVGFASLLTTDMPVVQSFGVYAAIGVAMAYLTVLFIVPLALMWANPGARKLPHGREGLLGGLMDRAVRLTTRHAWACVLGGVVVTGLSAVAGSYVVTNWRITESFDEDHPVSIANRIADDELGGVLALEFDLVGPPGSFERLEVLQDVLALEREARTIDGVRTTVGPASLLETTGGLLGMTTSLPESEQGVRFVYGVAERAGMLGAFVSEDRSRARVMVRTQDMGAVGFLDVGAQLAERFAATLAPHDVDSHLTGATFVSSRGIKRVTTDMRNSLISAFAFIGLIIAVLFRSVRFGLLSLIPNALPLIIGYGAMGLLGWELEPGRAVVFTIALGVSVDSAIHILARFHEERARGASVDESIESSILHSGRAITITAVMLIVGFAVNVNSLSPQNAAFGRLGSIIILAAIFSNLIVLPAMLKLGMGGTKKVASPL